jgi:hypothetical protein
VECPAGDSGPSLRREVILNDYHHVAGERDLRTGAWRFVRLELI